MKILLITILVCLSGPATAQCESKIDPFTKKKIITNELVKIGKNKNGNYDRVKFLRCKVGYLDSAYYVVFAPEFSNIQTMREKSSISIMFTDNTIMSLVLDDDSISNYTTGEAFMQGTSATIWYNYLYFELNEIQLERLKTKKISLVRCGANDYKTDENKADVIPKQIMCIEKSK